MSKVSVSNSGSKPTVGTESAALPCFVRVTGTLANRFVEFEFAISDPELAVELVLRFDQFDEFCARHRPTVITPEEGVRLDWERMKWRYGAPGIDH